MAAASAASFLPRLPLMRYGATSLGAISLTSSWVIAPFTEGAISTSAPFSASCRVRLSVSMAWADFHWFMASVRPR